MKISLIPLMVNFMIYNNLKSTSVSEISDLAKHLSLDFSSEDILIETSKAYNTFLIDDVEELIYIREDARNKLKPFLLSPEIIEQILSFNIKKLSD